MPVSHLLAVYCTPHLASPHPFLPPFLSFQGFRTPEEVTRFHTMFDELCYIVATKHSGSLKGEHGTGRNIAPYVEMEWGEWCRVGGGGVRVCVCGTAGV